MPPTKKARAISTYFRPALSCEQRVANMAAELKSVRTTIKKVCRQARAQQTPWTPSAAVIRQAVLVYELSQETHWAIVYVRMHQQQHMFRTSRMPRDTTAMKIKDWWSASRTTLAFRQAMATLSHPDRVKVDSFLIESVLYEFLLEKSSLQLVIPSTVMVAKYVKAWECRPMSEVTKRKIANLKEDVVHRRNWCAGFRRRWNVAWGVTPPGKTMTVTEMKNRARVLE